MARSLCAAASLSLLRATLHSGVARRATSLLGASNDSRMLALLLALGSANNGTTEARVRHTMVSAKPAETYALLFRGHPLRWGCTFRGVYLQRLCIFSHFEMIVKPLQALGHTVDLYVPNRSTHNSRECDLAHALALKQLRPLVFEPAPDSTTQSGDMRAMLNFFYMRSRSLGNTYDFLVVTRFDVRYLMPIDSWACRTPGSRQKLGITGSCGSIHQPWCTFDMLHVVPAAHLAGFDRSIGNWSVPGSRTSNCCFSKNCKLPLPGTGQACLNVFAHNLQGGRASISSCFAAPVPANHPANGPGYQCCRLGMTNWTRLYNAETGRNLSASEAASSPQRDVSFGWCTNTNPFRTPGRRPERCSLE